MTLEGSVTDYRGLVVMGAGLECDAWGQGTPHVPELATRLAGYWSAVLEHAQPTPWHLAWCGVFALASIKRAGLARDVFWVFGQGFAARHCQVTSDPQPGDVAYLAEPFQHHALVERVDPDGTVHTIDGNQPGIMRHAHPKHAWTCFYSIEPLLRAADPAQPTEEHGP